MRSYFSKFWRRQQTAQHATDGSDPISISPYAKVSLDPNGAAFLHVRSGLVFTSNRIGARIWRGLLERESVETIIARISDENGVPAAQARQDTVEFVAELEAQGFVLRRAEC
jgi:coenzyme PQQ synthesis protein D (PqqD)